uniref:Uncharacterized protein n=1 Tax=Rousettus aegyptiacus TaxID=9407 RepID=A0A7J8KAT6_ROUAE|nr:hypothetical protein HJG63_007825 [Rousettus aegyptiacus]
MMGPCSLTKGLIFPGSKATPPSLNPELGLLWAQHGCACEGNHTGERNLHLLRGRDWLGASARWKARMFWQTSSTLVGKLASKDKGLGLPKKFMPMPGRVPGTGFQRACLTEMSPGNSRANRASAPLASGLNSWL